MLIAQAVFWACYAGLALLTFAGERRRGSGVSVAICAGLAFPATWTVWYVRDRDRPPLLGARLRTRSPKPAAPR